MAFTKGKSGNPKGCPKGAHSKGRPPNWFKERLAQIASREESVEFIEDCIDGKNVDRTITQFGTVKKVAPNAGTRLAAWCEARDTGYGKPRQEVELSGGLQVNLIDVVREAREKRGLPLKPKR